MKRVMVILIAAFMLMGMALAAEESILIDFDQLVADYPEDSPTVNQATVMDFGATAGSSFTEDEKKLMKTSLAIDSWEARLSPSSRTIFNQEYTLVKKATVKEDAPENNFPGKNVLGVRAHFPQELYNGYVEIRPPFEIPAYADKATINDDGEQEVADEDKGKGAKFEGFGVIKNVGVLKNVFVWVYGRNFPYKISVLAQHGDTEVKEFPLGHLQFDGWRRLEWKNANYITEVRNRDLVQVPLYPKTAPVLKLVGFRIYRDGVQAGDDSVCYIKDVSVVYDKALRRMDSDIDDEAVWGILQKREEARRNAEAKRMGNIQVLRFIEKEKMHQETREAGEEAEE